MSERKTASRAEVARQRRAARAKSELDQTSRRAVKPSVSVSQRRDPQSYVVPRERRSAKSTRRFTAAIGLPGVGRVRGVTFPRIQASWQTVSAVTALGLVLAVILLLTLPIFRISSAVVVGNSRVSSEEINTALGLSGDSIFLVRPQDAALRLPVLLPALKSVEIKVALPNKVLVTVTERQPVILWQQGEGYTWVDSEGIAFQPRGSADGLVNVIGVDTPVVELPEPVEGEETQLVTAPRPFMHKELVDSIMILAAAVPPGSTMIYETEHGLGWTDSLGWKAYFGTGMKDMPLKLKVYQELSKSLVERGITPELVSVEYAEAPYYTLAEDQSQANTDDGQ